MNLFVQRGAKREGIFISKEGFVEHQREFENTRKKDTDILHYIVAKILWVAGREGSALIQIYRSYAPE